MQCDAPPLQTLRAEFVEEAVITPLTLLFGSLAKVAGVARSIQCHLHTICQPYPRTRLPPMGTTSLTCSRRQT